jgi:predicted transcriptional regulator of viral defense system
VSVPAVGILDVLQREGMRIFRTGDAMTLTGLKEPAAAHALGRLADNNLLIKVRRGLWALAGAKDLSAYELVPFLTAPWPGYVSLHTALSIHGVVAEIPHVVTAVTSGRPLKHRAALGDFRIHHLPERFMWGFEMRPSAGGAFPLADPEKAFLDLIYLASVPSSGLRPPQKRGRRWALDANKLKAYAKRFDVQPVTDFLKANKLYD